MMTMRLQTEHQHGASIYLLFKGYSGELSDSQRPNESAAICSRDAQSERLAVYVNLLFPTECLISETLRNGRPIVLRNIVL